MTEQQPEVHVRAVPIPVDPAEPVVVGTVDASPAGRCAAVGGAQPEALPLDAGTTMFLDGYGKAKRLPRNSRATGLADAMRPGFARHDLVAGRALVVGSDKDSGKPVDVGDDVVRSVPTS